VPERSSQLTANRTRAGRLSWTDVLFGATYVSPVLPVWSNGRNPRARQWGVAELAGFVQSGSGIERNYVRSGEVAERRFRSVYGSATSRPCGSFRVADQLDTIGKSCAVGEEPRLAQHIHRGRLSKLRRAPLAASVRGSTDMPFKSSTCDTLIRLRRSMNSGRCRIGSQAGETATEGKYGSP
jgi:hypothetical protein